MIIKYDIDTYGAVEKKVTKAQLEKELRNIYRCGLYNNKVKITIDTEGKDVHLTTAYFQRDKDSRYYSELDCFEYIYVDTYTIDETGKVTKTTKEIPRSTFQEKGFDIIKKIGDKYNESAHLQQNYKWNELKMYSTFKTMCGGYLYKYYESLTENEK